MNLLLILIGMGIGMFKILIPPQHGDSDPVVACHEPIIRDSHTGPLRGLKWGKKVQRVSGKCNGCLPACWALKQQRVSSKCKTNFEQDHICMDSQNRAYIKSKQVWIHFRQVSVHFRLVGIHFRQVCFFFYIFCDISTHIIIIIIIIIIILLPIGVGLAL